MNQRLPFGDIRPTATDALRDSLDAQRHGRRHDPSRETRMASLILEMVERLDDLQNRIAKLEQPRSAVDWTSPSPAEHPD